MWGGAESPRGVRDKMMFIMRAPTCVPWSLATPTRVARAPLGVPGSPKLSVWSALPHT